VTTLAATLVESEGVLADLAPDWWDLWRRCPRATPFNSPAWLLPWWRTFRPGRLASVAVHAGGRLVGLAPLWHEAGPLGRRLLPLGIGITDSFDVLIDPTCESVAGEIAGAAAELAPDWDILSLEELPPEALGLSLPFRGATSDEVVQQSACPVLDLASGPPRAKLRKLRMSRNRVARRAGGLESVAMECLPSFLDHLARLHGARWAERGEAGVLADDAVRRFHAAALPQLTAAGLARLLTLTIEGQVVGAYYGLQHGAAAYAYLGGFDPRFAFESPGTVLIGQAIEAARAEGATEFHFLRGREPYKYEWGATDHWTWRRTVRR
jgi:CelD/BcsL family acetyltransferase involved in cellulose biosynthesis